MDHSQDPNPLSTQPYRGTRDFFPDLQRQRLALFSAWRSTLLAHGYEEYDAPLLEPLDLYAAKSSDEIVREQLYRFEDRGGRQVAIRPEMTPSLARMVAAKAPQLMRPIRWFSVPRCLRYERPQRGRLREFDQLNVDVFGGQALDENIEILSICAALMAKLGAPASAFEILLNDRRLLNDLLLHAAGLAPEQTAQAIALIDRKDKLEPQAFVARWSAMLGLEQMPSAHEHVIRLFERGVADDHILKALSPFGQGVWRELIVVRDTLASLHPGIAVRIDLGIARGFNYYTGLVFEIFDTHPDNRRALFGGGRYDNLTAAFGTEALPGVGFGVSDVSLLNFCETHGLRLPGASRDIDIAVVRFSPDDRQAAFALADHLRGVGLLCTAPLTEQKFGKQLQAAEKLSALAVAFRGASELASHSFAVKWLASGTQENFSLDAVGLEACAEKARLARAAEGSAHGQRP